MKPAPKNLSPKQRLIERARTEIRIEDLLNDLFEIYVPYDAQSWKVRCPLAYEHEDGGLDKQFRVYSDNNQGYCFAMHGRFDTLTLWRLQHDYNTLVDAAEGLLAAYGKSTKALTYQERIEALQAPTEFKVDKDGVVDAFNVWLSAQPKYEANQYRQEVLHAVNSFLSGVTQICENAVSMMEVDEWYQNRKEQISTLLNSL